MHTRSGQWRKHPDEIVRHEEMRPGRPMLLITVKTLQVPHALLAGRRMPLRQTRAGSVMHDDELRTPIAESQRGDVFLEFLRSETEADDSFPLRHGMFLS